MRAPGAAIDFDRHDVELDRSCRDRTAPAVVVRTRSRGPPSASSTVSRDAPKPRSASSRGERRRAVAVGGQRQHARARLQHAGGSRSSVRPCSETSAVSGSAQPSRAAARLNAEGAGTTTHLVGRERAAPASRRRRNGTDRRRRARRRAGRDAPAPPRRARVERARPWPRRAADQRRRQAEMALAAEHDLGAAHDGARAPRRSARRCRPRRCRRWTASGACGSSAQRSASACDVLILGGTSEARRLAERLAGARDLP